MEDFSGRSCCCPERYVGIEDTGPFRDPTICFPWLVRWDKGVRYESYL